MTGFTDLDDVQEAIWENDERPRGIAQATAAEGILAGAEGLGQPEALIKALLHLVDAYEYTTERARILVPFARALQLWDTDPEKFDEYDVYALHWYFKWASSGMLRVPEVSLAAIEQWLEQMRSRYRLAGHSTRAVWQAEHLIACHRGDTERAAAALGEWWAAERDDMADCDACETSDRGKWHAVQGEDAAAIEAWAPVLTGQLTCAEEPHRVLAAALLPLVRLGRPDEAVAAHLRGYQLARGAESLTIAIAHHIEFCALTGNEARGLEILAEQSAGFADSDTEARLAFLTATAVLMARLVALGHSGLVVPGPAGTEWTAVELAAHARDEALAIAARFDARNGTDAVGRRVAAQLGATPLVARLALGVRSSLRPPAALSGVAPTQTIPAETIPQPAEPAPEPAKTIPEPAETIPEPVEGSSTEPDAIDRAVLEAIERHRAALASDDLRTARDELLVALATAGERGGDAWKASTHGAVAELSADLDEYELAVQHAREAASWSDLTDQPGFARVRLGALLLTTDRYDEASAVLQHALLDLADMEEQPEEALVRVHRWLGECERQAGDPLAAARHWASAAQITQGWEAQDEHAVLSYLIGGALQDAGRPDDAVPALERAADLWGDLDRPVQRAMAQRSRAWLEASRNPQLSGELLTAAAEELAVRLPAAEPELAVDLREELAETRRLHALAITRQGPEGWEGEYPGALDEAYRSTLSAVAVLDGSEPDPMLGLRCHLLAGELAAALGDPAAARQHFSAITDLELAGDEQESLQEYAQELLDELGQG